MIRHIIFRSPSPTCLDRNPAQLSYWLRPGARTKFSARLRATHSLDGTGLAGVRFAMDYRERIIIDPEIRFGKPTVRGTRITVGDVLSYLAGGMSEDEILADFPQLTREDIRACLAFAAERERRLASVPA